MAITPEDRDRLTKSVVGDIKQRDATSQAEHKRRGSMTEDERRIELTASRANRRPHSGEVTTDIDIINEQTSRRIESSKRYKSRLVAPGQVGLHGSIEKTKK